VDRITRKQLKKDKFAQEVGHTVEYLEVHRRQLFIYGGIALAVVLLVAGIFYYNHRQYISRQEALRSALNNMDAPVGPSPAPGVLTYPTADEKNRAVTKAFTDIATKNSGSNEASVAEYYLGVIALDAGKMDEAIKRLNTAAQAGNSDYASLAKFSLADIYASQGKPADAEKLLRELLNHPTILVSKEQATIQLAKAIAPAKPDEARKLLEPLRSAPGAVGRAAMTVYGDLFVKR
jgi:predicted negative regulator of RcsB-dependent stress response